MFLFTHHENPSAFQSVAITSECIFGVDSQNKGVSDFITVGHYKNTLNYLTIDLYVVDYQYREEVKILLTLAKLKNSKLVFFNGIFKYEVNLKDP